MSVTQQPAYPAPPHYPPPWPYAPPPPRRSGYVVMALVIAAFLAVIGTVATVVVLATGGDRAIEGNGYSYEMADDWSDLTGTEGTLGLDTVSGTGSNMIDGDEGLAVGVTTDPAATDEARLRDLAARSLSAMPSAGTPEDVASVSIDGDSAVGLRTTYVSPQTGADYVITAYAVVHDDRLYTVSYSSKGGLESHDTGKLTRVLDTWGWE